MRGILGSTFSVGARGMVFAALSGAAASSALGSTVVYTDQSTFLSNIGPTYYLEQFSTVRAEATSLSFGVTNGFSYVASSPSNVLTNPTIGGGFLTTGGIWSGALTIDFTGSPTTVTAFGANFFDNNINFQFATGDLTIVLSDDTTVSITGAQLQSFRGFTSDLAIESFTLTSTTANLWPGIDNLYVGEASTALTVVPLPPAAMAGLSALAAVAGVSFVRRRRLRA
jgi:hypothetical protein